MNLERYERGFSEDHRGNVEFFNELNLSDYKRFYTVTNPKIGTVRAWHGHKNEKKLIKVLSGKFLVGVIEIDDWENPDKTIDPEMVEMDINSDLLSIPEGYANGAMNLEENSKIMYFSSSTLEDSLSDDYRFDSKYWDPWTSNGGELFE